MEMIYINYIFSLLITSLHASLDLDHVG